MSGFENVDGVLGIERFPGDGCAYVKAKSVTDKANLHVGSPLVESD